MVPRLPIVDHGPGGGDENYGAQGVEAALTDEEQSEVLAPQGGGRAQDDQGEDVPQDSHSSCRKKLKNGVGFEVISYESDWF